ncbi:MAG: hypothetical protein HY690_04695 [Chloroflexi bacterium]|nr:hypothetical protein [Chloroflexota bacterium]
MIFQPADAGGDEPPPYEPHLAFTAPAWRKLVLYVLNCPFEIGGLGLVEARGQDFLVTDVLLVEQDVNDIATRLDSGAVSALLLQLLESGRDPGELKLWWHSHAHEAPFWSGVDEQTIERFQNDFMLSVVSNHELRFLARQDHYAPRRTTWVWVDKPSDGLESSPEEVEAVRAEIAARTRHVPRDRTRIF